MARSVRGCRPLSRVRCILARLARDERGSVLVVIAAGLASLVGSAALTLDAGRYLEMRRQLQNAVDAAAHAGAQELPDLLAAQQVAEEYWLLNRPPMQDTSFQVEFPLATDPRLRFTATGRVNLLFAGALGFDFADVGAAATAEIQMVPLPYALMAMDPVACASLEVQGGAQMTVTNGGGVYARSTCEPNALFVRGQSRLQSARNDVVGGAATDGPGVISPAANEGARMRDDAFASMLSPPVPPTCHTGPYDLSSGTHVLSPDVRYCQRLRVSSTAQVTFLPGVYVLQQGMSVDGQSVLTSGDEGVLLYNTCPSIPCNGVRPADMTFAGQGTADLRGHAAYGSMVVWVDSSAGATPDPPLVSLSGQAAQGLAGSIYVPSGHVDIAGQSGVTVELSVSVVSGTIDIRGNGSITIRYDEATAPREQVVVLVE